MQTVKDWIFKALYKTKDLTKYSIILAIYLMSHCDEDGRITIHHADMERIMDVDSKVFYANLHRLLDTKVRYNIEDDVIETPLVVKEKSHCKGDICLKIPYNDFNKDNSFTNFVKVDYAWLKCATLKTLTHAEIRVLLYLFFRAFKSGDLSNTINFKSKFSAYRSIGKQLDISTQTVRKAIYRIKKCECIKVDSSANCEDEQTEQSLAAPQSKVHFAFCDCFMAKICNVVTTSKVNIFGKHVQAETTEKHFRSDRHIVRNILRRQHKRGKYIAPEQDINDIAQLLNMYRDRAKGKIVEIVDKAIADCALIRAALVHQRILDQFKILEI